jgi:hypothetical protein
MELPLGASHSIETILTFSLVCEAGCAACRDDVQTALSQPITPDWGWRYGETTLSGELPCGGAAVGEARTFKIYAVRAAGDGAAD